MDSSTTTTPNTANGTEPGARTRYGKPLPPSWIPLYQKPLGTPTRRLRVVTIGAAVAGMGFAYKLQHEHKLTEEGIDGRDGPLVEHAIYEANGDIGGTWLVNTYPGVACDVPAHVYAFPFEVGLSKYFLPISHRPPGRNPTSPRRRASKFVGETYNFRFSPTLPGAHSTPAERRSWHTSSERSPSTTSTGT